MILLNAYSVSGTDLDPFYTLMCKCFKVGAIITPKFQMRKLKHRHSSPMAIQSQDLKQADRLQSQCSSERPL